MQRAEAHIYFLETIGMGDWFWGTTLNDVRYCVEGEGVFSADAADTVLPQKVVLHFPTCKGGDVVEGYGMYNYLRGLSAKGVQVEARVEGLCASIATLIALAADTVLMAEAALWMVHKPSSGGCGNADELRAEADVLDKIQAQLAGRYVARSGGKLDVATAHELINKESWLNADECIAYGFATGKLHEDPIKVPEGADAVLNYFPTTKQTAPAMAITPAEETRLLDKFVNAVKTLFKNEEAPVVEPVATNTSIEVDGDTGPIYFEGAELAEGAAVYSDEALTVAYADGTYTLADGREVTVAAGLAETIKDAASTDAATNTAELEATNAALLEEIAALKATNALQARAVTGLTNKLATIVPGSTGAPTKAGDVQNLTDKTTPEPAVERAAERSVFLRTIPK